MPKTLVIVESPTKAKTLERYLGRDYTVRASYGHIRDLPKSKLGVDPEQGFEPEYVVPGLEREGRSGAPRGAEAIGRSGPRDRLRPRGRGDRLPRRRDPRRRSRQRQAGHVHRDHQGRDPRGVRAPPRDQPPARRGAAGAADPRSARRLPDLPDPVEEGPARTLGRPRAVGRPAPDRRSGAGDPRVHARRVLERRRSPHARRTPRIPSSRASSRSPRASSRPRRTRRASTWRTSPTPAFTWSACGRPATGSARSANRSASDPRRPRSRRPRSSRRRGASSGSRPARPCGSPSSSTRASTSRAREPVGLITYMRTDSVTIAETALREIAELVRTDYGERYGLAEPRRYKTKSRGAQEAHEAIRPTSVMRTPDRMRSALDNDQHRLYRLIWQRAVASQMAEARFKQLSVDTEANADGADLRTSLDRPAAAVRRLPSRLLRGSGRSAR